MWTASVPILLSVFEKEQRPSGNEDREAIVVGTCLCDGEGERAYTGYAPQFSFYIPLDRRRWSSQDLL